MSTPTATIDYKPVDSRRARGLIARIQKHPDDVTAIRALQRLYEDEGDHPSLVNLLEGWGDALSEAHSAASAYVEAADLALATLNDRDRAKLLYERALSRQPGNPEALDRALRLLETAQDFERTKQVLKFVAFRLETDGGDALHRAQVHYRLGLTYEQHFSEPGKAAREYRKAIELHPKLTTAITAARRIYAQVGNLKALCLLCELEIEATTVTEDKHALLLSLADLRRQAGDLDGAILALRHALKLLPAHVPTLRTLADALATRAEQRGGQEREVDRSRAAEVLYQVARALPRAQAAEALEQALALRVDHEAALAFAAELAREASAPAADPLPVRAHPSARPPAARPATLPPPSPAAASPAAASPAAASPAAAPVVRDSTEAWLTETSFDAVNVLSTSELVPLDDARTASNAPPARPSSLPPPSLSPRPSPPPPPSGRPSTALPPPAKPIEPGPTRARVLAHALALDDGRPSVEVNLGVTTDSNFYVGFSNRIADGGVFVATYNPLPKDAKVALHVTLPGTFTACAHGVVRLVRDTLEPFGDDVPGMCVELEALEESALALFERFAQKRAPLFIDS